jgi:hypothetical protein
MRHAPDCEHCVYVCEGRYGGEAYLCSQGTRHSNLRCFGPADWCIRVINSDPDRSFRCGCSLDYLSHNRHHLYEQGLYNHVLCEAVRRGVISKTRADRVYVEES